MVPLLFTIRTANRAPKRNYVGRTVSDLLAKGVDPALLHLFPTDPDVAWLFEEIGDAPVRVHVPDRRYSPNENGVRQVTALDDVDAEWIGLCEDDIETCADPLGSMARWLAHQARPDITVYRFFALPQTPVVKQGKGFTLSPLKEMRGSQAVALRHLDARAFRHWAEAHPRNWRPKDAPYQDRPEKGFDKLIGYWALQRYPRQPYGLVSRPYFVRHVGLESALYSHGLRNDREFAGPNWRYEASV